MYISKGINDHVTLDPERQGEGINLKTHRQAGRQINRDIRVLCDNNKETYQHVYVYACNHLCVYNTGTQSDMHMSESTYIYICRYVSMSIIICTYTYRYIACV